MRDGITLHKDCSDGRGGVNCELALKKEDKRNASRFHGVFWMNLNNMGGQSKR